MNKIFILLLICLSITACSNSHKGNNAKLINYLLQDSRFVGFSPDIEIDSLLRKDNRSITVSKLGNDVFLNKHSIYKVFYSKIAHSNAYTICVDNNWENFYWFTGSTNDLSKVLKYEQVELKNENALHRIALFYITEILNPLPPELEKWNSKIINTITDLDTYKPLGDLSSNDEWGRKRNDIFSKYKSLVMPAKFTIDNNTVNYVFCAWNPLGGYLYKAKMSIDANYGMCISDTLMAENVGPFRSALE